MFARLLTLLALLLPAAALAQVAPRTTIVEVVATGEFDAPASSFIVAVSWTASGEDKDAARKAQDDKQAEVHAALDALGIAPTAVTMNPGTDFTTGYDALAYTNSTVIAMPDIEVNAVDFPTDDSVIVVTSVTDKMTVRVTSLAQAAELRLALQKIDAEISGITPVLDDPDGARRKAKTMALTSARGDADAYAAAMGMRVIRVSRISEAGNGLLLPGLQDKMSRLFSGGPEAMMRTMFEVKPGFIHVEASIIVEFELVPIAGARP